MKVIACYPRCMSAWISNLLTIPHCSLYAHDILLHPDMVQVIEDVDYPHKGIVDTAATADNLPACELTVIDADTDGVKDRLERLMGADMTAVMETLTGHIESLKPRATVVHLDRMDEWMPELFEQHTGLPFDGSRYAMLKNLNVQSQMAHAWRM